VACVPQQSRAKSGFEQIDAKTGVKNFNKINNLHVTLCILCKMSEYFGVLLLLWMNQCLKI
jgi:hypothetical protein